MRSSMNLTLKLEKENMTNTTKTLDDIYEELEFLRAWTHARIDATTKHNKLSLEIWFAFNNYGILLWKAKA